MNASYYTIKDDGAPIKCDECKERTSDFSSIYLVITPDGRRRVLHKDCIEPDWLEMAEFKGPYTTI